MRPASPRPPTPDGFDNLEPENSDLDEDLLDGLRTEADPSTLPPEDDPPPPPSDDEDGYPSSSDDEDDPLITLESMRTNWRFIQMVREATLESQLGPAELDTFRNPEEIKFSPSEDRDLRLSISFFISGLDHNASQEHYASSRQNIKDAYEDSEMLSYDQVKRKVTQLSGVLTWKHHMCVDTCAAFTGPFADLEGCPVCSKPRYDQDELRRSGGKKKVPQKVFTTFPLGPQLQSRWRSPSATRDMHYRREKTRELLHKRDQEGFYDFDDIFCGSDYLEAVDRGKIKDEDTVVMFSVDGAQLLRNKKSDCWIYIWIILDLAPDRRYKIRSIVPGGVVPGPKKPKHLDSFLFPGLAHVSAVQKEGMMVWDGHRRVKTSSNIFVWLVLADAIAMADVNGSVGPGGRKGCRLLCDFMGRNKPAGSHYYPALLRPLDSYNESCDHPDQTIDDIPDPNPASYRRNLNYVLESETNAEYERRRLATGITKAPIFDGLPRILKLPTCFPGNLMHQPVINVPALFFELWHNRGNCREGASARDIWEWAVLRGNVWRTHGRAVADAGRYLPRSFDRAPQNPAEKLSSGYKAWELLIYFYGMGPGMFYGILPEKYYRHYCKLVVAIRIMYQREISPAQLQLANVFLREWLVEFEEIYYCRKTDRLHFVRQCVHSLIHLVPEALRVGPPSLSSQWTMERVIGVFGSLIKQPSNPFANLTEQAKKVAEVNTITAMWPSFERIKKDPYGSVDIGDGYLLLGPKDTKPHHLPDVEYAALAAFYSGFGSVPRKSLHRCGRLRIPTGPTVVRSFWKEVVRSRASRAARTDRNVAVRHST